MNCNLCNDPGKKIEQPSLFSDVILTYYICINYKCKNFYKKLEPKQKRIKREKIGEQLKLL